MHTLHMPHGWGVASIGRLDYSMSFIFMVIVFKKKHVYFDQDQDLKTRL